VIFENRNHCHSCHKTTDAGAEYDARFVLNPNRADRTAAQYLKKWGNQFTY